MHPETLAKSLAGIEPKITVDEFQKASGIASRSIVKNVLDFLQSYGIGRISKNEIIFTNLDKLHVAALALQMGCDIEQVSRHLSWKDFEELASKVLQSLGYKTMTNVRLTKPRMEIDVVGINSGFAIVIDCKHWKRNNVSSISNYSRKQVARTERLVAHDRRIVLAVPIVLTLHSESVQLIEGIPIVPIFRFKSFVMDVNGFLSEIYVVSARG